MENLQRGPGPLSSDTSLCCSSLAAAFIYSYIKNIQPLKVSKNNIWNTRGCPHTSSLFPPVFVWNSGHSWLLSICLSLLLSKCHHLIGCPSSSSSSSPIPMGKYADTFWFDYGSQTKLCSITFQLRQTDHLRRRRSKALNMAGVKGVILISNILKTSFQGFGSTWSIQWSPDTPAVSLHTPNESITFISFTVSIPLLTAAMVHRWPLKAVMCHYIKMQHQELCALLFVH